MPESEKRKAREAGPDSEAEAVQQTGWRGHLAVLPGIGVALLPKLTCPACWPVYAGLLGSLGLGFAGYAAYILPLTLLFLVIAVASLGWRAERRRGYWPFILGTLGALIVIIGKFILNSGLALYGGIALLTAASLWNSWPLRKEGRGSCPACASWDGGSRTDAQERR